MHVEYRNVVKRFGTHTVLDGFSLRVEPASVVLLLGANGSGKSTALRLLVGLVKPDAGRVLVEGTDYAGVAAVARRVGAALGGATVDQELTAEQLLGLRATTIGAGRSVADAALADAGLRRAAAKRVRELSTGMQARVRLAAATMGQPDLLVLDEPFANLDPDGRDWLAEHLTTLRDRGGTALIASHHRETYDIGDRWFDLVTNKEVKSRRAAVRSGGRK